MSSFYLQYCTDFRQTGGLPALFCAKGSPAFLFTCFFPNFRANTMSRSQANRSISHDDLVISPPQSLWQVYGDRLSTQKTALSKRPTTFHIYKPCHV